MLYLDEEEVRSLLDLDRLREAVASVLRELSEGKAIMATRVVVPSAKGLTANMVSRVPSLGVVATKTVTVFPGNPGGVLPTHQATILVTDAATGEPIAFMDGTYITAARTAAASAIATDLLASPDAKTMAILGTGVQARSHAAAIPRVRAIAEVTVAGRDLEKAKRLAGELAASGLVTTATEDFSAAQSGVDIVCATTHSPDPVVFGELLAPGTHVNSVGVNVEGREVDEAAVRRAKVIALESRQAALAPAEEAGANDLTWAIRDGAITAESVVELGELLKHGRGSSEKSQITVYKGVGVAVEDAAAAWLAMNEAKRTGMGSVLNR